MSEYFIHPAETVPDEPQQPGIIKGAGKFFNALYLGDKKAKIEVEYPLTDYTIALYMRMPWETEFTHYVMTSNNRVYINGTGSDGTLNWITVENKTIIIDKPSAVIDEFIITPRALGEETIKTMVDVPLYDIKESAIQRIKLEEIKESLSDALTLLQEISFNLDGGRADSIYGGYDPIDGGRV